MRSSEQPALLRRELTIALRARVTWVVTALASLLIGHGFVLALDLYVAASRSVAAGSLMAREMDPLAGIVRPTLGGAQLAVTLFVPILAARLLGIEKERRSFEALCLAAGAPARVVTAKLAAAFVVAGLVVTPSVVVLVMFNALGGHLDPYETVIAIAGHALHAVLIAAIAVAAAAWTRTLAQATTIALVISTASWVIDAGEGYAALAWLGPVEAVSVSRALAPFQEGLVAASSVGWLLIGIATAGGLALVGGRIDVSIQRRRVWAVLLLAGSCVFFVTATRWKRTYDWTEYRRASYPPAVVEALRSIKEPIVLEVWLDREDSRRRHIERDALAKLRLARADADIQMPLDAREVVGLGDRDEGYGRIVIHVGERSGETRSTSRSELATRVFEVAGRELPSFGQAPYPGYPLVLSAARLRVLRLATYVVVPCIVLLLGAAMTRRRRKKTT